MRSKLKFEGKVSEYWHRNKILSIQSKASQTRNWNRFRNSEIGIYLCGMQSRNVISKHHNWFQQLEFCVGTKQKSELTTQIRSYCSSSYQFRSSEVLIDFEIEQKRCQKSHSFRNRNCSELLESNLSLFQMANCNRKYLFIRPHSLISKSEIRFEFLYELESHFQPSTEINYDITFSTIDFDFEIWN